MLTHKTLGLAALMALALLPGREAEAGYVSGWDLLEICKASPSDPVYRLKGAQCQGYVVGVADTFDCTEQLHGFTWDSSTRVAQPELVKVAVDWLSAHPDLLGREADGLVAAALHDSYPCK